jgi:UDP-glucose-4-epimerase GalE
MALSFLLTGGAGYVGSHACKHLLSQGHRVTVLDNLSRGHRDGVPSGATFAEVDLLDAAGVRRALAAGPVDVVMHFAAFAYVGESVTSPREYYRNNIVGTLDLLDAMVEAGARTMVFSSTCATYGVPTETPISEAHAQRPVNPYGQTKLAIERALADYSNAYGLSTVSLRYFNAAGCDPDGELGERHEPETHLIPLVLREALRLRDGGDPAGTALVVNGDDFETPDGTCIRDYIHVMDLADAHLRAAQWLGRQEAPRAAAFNLGTGRGHSVLEVIEACRKVTGMPIRYSVGPRRAGDPPALVASAAKAGAELGWRPRFVNLDDTIATAWRWILKR